jgi:hypothetical protein
MKVKNTMQKLCINCKFFYKARPEMDNNLGKCSRFNQLSLIDGKPQPELYAFADHERRGIVSHYPCGMGAEFFDEKAVEEVTNV